MFRLLEFGTQDARKVSLKMRLNLKRGEPGCRGKRVGFDIRAFCVVSQSSRFFYRLFAAEIFYWKILKFLFRIAITFIKVYLYVIILFK